MSTTFNLEENPDIKARQVGMSARLLGGQLVALPGLIYPSPAEDDLGGIGCYSTAPDFMKLLTSLVARDGKLLKDSTIDEMLKPQLSDSKYLEQALEIPDIGNIIGYNIPKGMKVNYGLGGLINMEPTKSGRHEGSMQWGGMPNLFWVSRIYLRKSVRVYQTFRR